MLDIIVPGLGLLLWPAVLSFVPNVFYIILNPLQSYKAEEAKSRGIFILSAEDKLALEKKRILRHLMLIYGICFLIFAGVFVFNWIKNAVFSAYPLDIFSSIFVVLFWIALLSYFPFAFFMIFRRPWKFREEAVFLRDVFIYYGAALLFFAAYFAWSWILAHQVPTGAAELFSSLGVVFLGTVIVSYLPIVCYMFFRSFVSKNSREDISLNVLFVIFCCSFLLFATIYIINWISDKGLLQ